MTKRHMDIYSRTLVKLPTPRFVVIYNGAEDTPDRMELHLSDAFEDKEKIAGKFEWTSYEFAFTASCAAFANSLCRLLSALKHKCGA